MTFDYRKFLSENDLTTTARLRTKFNNEEELPDEDQIEDGSTDEETPEGDSLAKYFDDKPGIEDEPAVDTAPKSASSVEKQGLRSAQNDHVKLQKLTAQKDEILAKYKSGEISLDQYRTQVGTIPNEIKAIQAKMSQGLEGEEEGTEEN